MNLIILAAGQGLRLRPLTDNKPKCLVPVGGKPILEWTLSAANAVGFSDIVVVGGHGIESLMSYGVKVIHNDRHRDTNMVRSLFCAERFFGSEFVISYGDIIYHPKILRRLVESTNEISVVVDDGWLDYWGKRFIDPLEDAETLRIEKQTISEIGKKTRNIEDIHSQYIGLLGFRAAGVEAIRKCFADALQAEKTGNLRFGGAKTVDGMFMTDLLQGMIDRKLRLTPLRIKGGWAEIDNLSDQRLADEMAAAGVFC